MNANKLISVIIPVKNGSKYLANAIERIINQKLNTEIIVVNDCSQDNTIEIAKKYNCKIIEHNTTKGPVAAKNSGLQSAEGEYILFHDYDDILRDNSLVEMKNILDNNKDIFAVEAKVQDFYSPEMSEEERSKIKIKSEPYYGLFTGAILIRKEVFNIIGLFDEKLYAGEILDWQSKMDSNSLKIMKTDIISTDRRIHNSNFGRKNKNTEFKNYAAILRQRIKR